MFLQFAMVGPENREMAGKFPDTAGEEKRILWLPENEGGGSLFVRKKHNLN